MVQKHLDVRLEDRDGRSRGVELGTVVRVRAGPAAKGEGWSASSREARATQMLTE